MKKVSTTAKLPTVARMLALKSPDVFREILKECEPMLKNLQLVQSINQEIKRQHPELDRPGTVLYSQPVFITHTHLQQCWKDL